MEVEIEDKLREHYQNIKIDVNYFDIRQYKITLTLEKIINFIYTYDAYLTFDANIVKIEREIDKCILAYYRRVYDN